MAATRRDAVLASVLERCSNAGWTLLGAHVRTNHVRLVIQADARPERVMNDLKSYASRRLNELGWDEPGRKRWARHGSTRRLCWKVCWRRFDTWLTRRASGWQLRESRLVIAPFGRGSVPARRRVAAREKVK